MRTKKLKLFYLLFIAIPVLYYFLAGKSSDNDVPKQQSDYFFFSIRTTAPATISLFTGKDSLISWDVNSAGYKYLDYVGNLNDNKGIVLKIRKLNANDTISFQGFNLYCGNRIFSLYESGEPQCIVKNAHLSKTGDALTAVVQNKGTPVSVRLQKSSSWEKPYDNRWFKILVILSFLVTFIIIVLIAPSVRYFIISCTLVLLLMILFFWIEKDFQCQEKISTKSPVKSFQTFYNNTPCFVAGKVLNSCNKGNSYNTTIDLNTNNCIRCDADGSAELADVHYKLNAGMFSYDWNLASIQHSGMLMNDLMLRNNKFYVTGDDPHFVFTSNYFIGHVQWLIMMRKNLFLFISLLIFIILTAMHRWLAGISSGPIQPAYLCFLLIPVTYYLLTQILGQAKPGNQKDFLYFSIRTTKPSLVELKDAGNTIDSWEVNSKGYKFLQYSGNCIEDAASLTISVKNLAAFDTITILSVNIFKNGHVISLEKNKGSLCQITNAGIIDSDGVIDAVVQTTDTPVDIILPPLYSWQKSMPERDIQIYVALLFIVLFLLILVLSPLTKYLMSICTMASIVMIVLFLIDRHLSSHVAMQTGNPVRSVNFFYNDNPGFAENKKISINDWTCFFKANIPFSENNYLRCGINKDTKELNSLQVMVKDGFLHHNMDLCDIPHDKMLFNDISYHNSSFIITGDDPYVCLTSGYFIRQLQWLMILKNNLFLFISLFIFIIYLGMHKLARENYK